MGLQLVAEKCRSSFFYFVKTFWNVIIKEEPVYNWHIEALCDELQALSVSIVDRKDKPYDLIINIPPGTTKSTITTIMFPAWLWTQDATIRIITNSYSSDLSIEHATKSRDIITSEKYRRLFPNIVLRRDKAAKSSYENTATGARYTTSTGGTITGKHAHVVINDDPLNPAQAASDADRNTANEHTKTLASRKVDKKNTPTITIMQRLHEMDVTGYILFRCFYNLCRCSGHTLIVCYDIFYLCRLRVYAHGRVYGCQRRRDVEASARGEAQDTQGQQRRSLCGHNRRLSRARKSVVDDIFSGVRACVCRSACADSDSGRVAGGIRRVRA